MAKNDLKKGRNCDNGAVLGRMFCQYWIFLILPIFFSCGENDPTGTHFDQYYFPTTELEDGLVYEYRSASGDSLSNEYWLYKRVDVENVAYLVGTYYDAYFQLRQYFRERITEKGTVVEDYFLYQPDSIGKSITYKANIIAASSFPFLLKDTTSVIVFGLKWEISQDPYHEIRITKNRQFSGRAKFAYKGERKDAVIFDLRERVEDDRDGVLEKEFTGSEIFAEGIGLVYYEKEIDQNVNLSYQLFDTYTPEEFEKKWGKQISTDID